MRVVGGGNKSLYSIQSVLGPRDIFPAYTVQSLKSTASRILIKSSEDYTISLSEEQASASSTSRKRVRPEDRRIEIRSDEKKLKIDPVEDNENMQQGAPCFQPIVANRIVLSDPEDFQAIKEVAASNHQDEKFAKNQLSPIPQPQRFQLERSGEEETDAHTSPFERWGIKFEGFPSSLEQSTKPDIGAPPCQDCGICGAKLLPLAGFRCTSCNLVVHQSCLQHTTLKDQVGDAKNAAQWTCPVCSLIAFCSKHPVNGIENLDREYFSCIFCPIKEPLIMMERMKSGLFSHSLCRFITNVEEESLKMCSICGIEGIGLVSES